MSIKAEIVGHSLSPQGDELISVLCTFPRIILAEVNTHRMLSKNTSSSRAIPYMKMLKTILDNPFIPVAFQKHHSGMQGTEYLDPNKKYVWGDFWEYLHEQFKKTFYNAENEKWEEEYDEFQSLFNTYVIPIFTSKEGGYTPSEWWLKTRDLVVSASLILHGIGVTKQLCNRLLEPFMWTTMLITGSREGWDNFFKLRCPIYTGETYRGGKLIKSTNFKSWKDLCHAGYNSEKAGIIQRLECNKGQAEIHMMALAESIYDAVNESTPKQLKAGEWHIPFNAKINDDTILQTIAKQDEIGHLNSAYDIYQYYAVKISTAMAAHTSYTIMGENKEMDYENMIDLTNSLTTRPYTTKKGKYISEDEPPHSSPTEHCARAMSDEEYVCHIKGKLDAEIDFDGYVDISTHINNHNSFGWCNNFKGFIPYRYMIDNKIEL